MEPRPVVYVDANGVRAALDRVEEDDTIDLVRAENGTDAVKLTAHTGAAAVVLSRDPPDATLYDIVERLVGIDPDVAVIVVGDPQIVPRGVWAIPEGAPPDMAYDRLLSALGDRQIDTAMDRFARLSVDVIRVAETAVAAGDRETIERKVHDALTAAAFGFAWIGRPRDGALELTVGYPFPGRIDFESVADAAGVDDADFLLDAVETGEVTAVRATGQADRTAGPGENCRAVAAIPLVHAGRTIGLIVGGTDDPTAFDATERSLLGRMGRLVGQAIGSATEEPPSDESALDRIGEFVDFFAHEVRNPLSVAVAYLELARDESEDDEALARVEGALASIEDFLESASALGKRADVGELAEVQLDSAATAAWESLDTPEAELEIVGGPAIMADRVLLEHVLTNLYRNAIEYGGQGVRVRVGGLPDGSGFFVEDDGPGIAEADRDRIFEWGFSTGEEGRGIGLGYVSRVAGAHGWQVDVRESAEGGARFEVITEEPTGSGLDALFDAWEPSTDDGSFAFTGNV